MGWYEKSFGKDYLMVYAHRDETGAHREVDQLLRWLKLEPKASILDLCCGNGRHSVAMAEQGYDVVGMDLSVDLLEVARARRVEEGTGSVRWVQGDSRKVPLQSESFDGLVNLFTSFGYFETDQENESVIQEMARLLKPGGRLVMDFLNANRIRQTMVPVSEKQINDMHIHERRWIADGFIHKEIRMSNLNLSDQEIHMDHKNRNERMYHERVRLYVKEDLVKMMQKNGIYVNAIYGDFEGNEYDSEQSPRLILTGQREKG